MTFFNRPTFSQIITTLTGMLPKDFTAIDVNNRDDGKHNYTDALAVDGEKSEPLYFN